MPPLAANPIALRPEAPARPVAEAAQSPRHLLVLSAWGAAAAAALICAGLLAFRRVTGQLTTPPPWGAAKWMLGVAVFAFAQRMACRRHSTAWPLQMVPSLLLVLCGVACTSLPVTAPAMTIWMIFIVSELFSWRAAMLWHSFQPGANSTARPARDLESRDFQEQDLERRRREARIGESRIDESHIDESNIDESRIGEAQDCEAEDGDERSGADELGSGSSLHEARLGRGLEAPLNETAINETALPAETTLRMTRRTSRDGERVDAQVRVFFERRQRRVAVHVSFVPQLAARPEVQAEVCEGPACRIAVEQQETYGVRLAVTREASRADQEEVAVLGLVATAAPRSTP